MPKHIQLNSIPIPHLNSGESLETHIFPNTIREIKHRKKHQRIIRNGWYGPVATIFIYLYFFHQIQLIHDDQCESDHTQMNKSNL